ncbi:B12-binding domain-containing protein [Desulfocucumis palustris]|uniref:B12-binding domain-containing protein n=1 Tax=Desulfocucumis palustris TaxID=1898651 RepID=UPI001E2DC6CE|nr:B12-binding domain-containing protein [Desulfocucumis palustris]
MNFNNIFIRYDLVIEGSADTPAKPRLSDDPVLQEVIDCVIEGDCERIEALVNKALETRSPLDVINLGLKIGMDEVSRLWDEGIYYLPQTLQSSDVMLLGVEICERKMNRPLDKKGVVVTHTAEGDLHDLGQKIVNAILRANGYEVIDLGKDVLVEDVLAAVLKYKPVMLTGTAGLTTTMYAFEKLAKLLAQSRVEVPFVCGGGGGVASDFINSLPLCIYGRDAREAPLIAAEAVRGLKWDLIREKMSARY